MKKYKVKLNGPCIPSLQSYEKEEKIKHIKKENKRMRKGRVENNMISETRPKFYFKGSLKTRTEPNIKLPGSINY